MVRRVAQYGQRFLPHLNPRDTWQQVGSETARIKAGMHAVGRDPSALEVGVRFPPFGKPFEEQLETDMEPMLAAGVTQLYCPLRAPQSVAEAAPPASSASCGVSRSSASASGSR